MKLGLVGSGMIVETVIDFIFDVEGIEIGALYCRDKTKGEELVKNTNIQYFDDYQNFLSSEKIDTVYIGLPNHIHHEFAKEALLKGKNAIVEKSFTLNLNDAIELKNIALANKLYLFEAITNIHLPEFEELKNKLKNLGDIKIINCNHSQYSSRYDSFKKGIVLPAFDKTKGGGALFDLNVYNIHFIVGLFSKPTNVKYYPNIEYGVDTSGILILEYPDFKAVCIGSKDTSAPITSTIQGNRGSIQIIGPVSTLSNNYIQLNNQEKQPLPSNKIHRMIPEFQNFAQIINSNNYDAMKQLLNHTIDVMEVLEKAKLSAHLFE